MPRQQRRRTGLGLAAALLATLASPAAAATLADLDAQEKATADLWTKLPFTTRNVMFVTREARAYGDYAARPTQTFAQGEKLRSYIEPIGYVWRPGGPDTVEFGIAIDFEFQTPSGEVVASKTNFLDNAITTHYRNREFFLNLTVTLDGAPPGDYVLVYKLRDKFGPGTTETRQPFHLQ